MGNYTCSKCDWEKLVYYDTGDDIKEVLAHDKTHEENVKEEMREEKVPCERCNGNGYTLEKYRVHVNVSEADSGRNE